MSDSNMDIESSNTVNYQYLGTPLNHFSTFEGSPSKTPLAKLKSKTPL
jgi:hypothetical protein